MAPSGFGNNNLNHYRNASRTGLAEALEHQRKQEREMKLEYELDRMRIRMLDLQNEVYQLKGRLKEKPPEIKKEPRRRFNWHIFEIFKRPSFK